MNRTAFTPAALGARALLAFLWLLQWLPLPVLAALGRALGALLHRVGRSRRRVAVANVALCLPELDAAARAALVREHFRWLGRSIIERALLWYAPRRRLERLVHVEGDVGLADRSERPVMWLVPHFLALDVAGVATQLFQGRRVCSIYSAQSNAVLDAAMKRGRIRFGNAEIFSRQESALPLVRAIKRGQAFFNLPDMDFGLRDAAFVPFFGHPAATLLAPSRLARSLGMVVQPVVAELLPGGQGWRVRFLDPWTDWPTDDAEADAARMNRWIEGEIRRNPAQYLWVHKRFKTRPPGAPPLY
ncbi:MAG: lipid A biosynthesis acyltransferase [Rubrivivax sp.]|nr:lipid A biosynthesis acyltransferase [Rubrivivax sp.]